VVQWISLLSVRHVENNLPAWFIIVCLLITIYLNIGAVLFIIDHQRNKLEFRYRWSTFEFVLCMILWPSVIREYMKYGRILTDGERK
jgi:hypothetical protein